MTDETISVEEFRHRVGEAVMTAAEFLPRSKRAGFLEALPAALERTLGEMADRRRRSQVRSVDDTSAGER